MKALAADIVIVSAGTAGLAAAVTAAENGAKVIVFEKSGNTGGTGNLAAGLCAVESRVQKVRQLTLTKEEVFKKHMDFNQWQVDARLVKTYYEKTADTIDWLEKMGAQFLGLCSHNPGFNYTMHIIGGMPQKPPRYNMGSGHILMKILAKRASELGVNIYLKTPVKKINKNGQRVTGVIAEDQSREEIQADAGAVLLAAGGYGGTGQGIPTVTGDGIRMAKEVGADVIDPGPFNRRSDIDSHPAASHTVMHSFQQPILGVNLQGERFINEEILGYSPFAINAIARQKGNTAFFIFDEDTKNEFVEKGFDLAPHGLLIPETKADDFDAEFQKALDLGDKSLFVADSIEELASKTGIDSQGLKKTVEEYNQACANGRDDIFYKSAKYLRPMTQPRFYASSRVLTAQRDWEGVKINYKTEVLTPEREVIKGLYAAGIETACNIYWGTYISTIPGNMMGYAINSGRMAAENAVSYFRSMNK